MVLEKLKKMPEKEIELNQLKLKFLSINSYELRKSLATIQTSADLIEIITGGVKEKKTGKAWPGRSIKSKLSLSV